MKTMTTKLVDTKAYIGTGVDDQFWAEGEPAKVEAIRSDKNEVRLAVTLEDGGTDDVTLYLTDTQAAELMVGLGAAIASDL